VIVLEGITCFNYFMWGLRNKNLIRYLKYRQGFSLVELLIGVGLSSAVALFAAMVIHTSAANFTVYSLRAEREEAVHNVAHALHNYFSMALNLRVANAPLSSFKDNIGQLVAEYNLNSWKATLSSGDIDVIAYFLRENLPSGWDYSKSAPSGAARFPVTVIYFQKPTINKYGVLYIKSDSSGASSLQASKSDLRLTHVVDFEVLDVFSTSFQNLGNYPEDTDLNGAQMVSSVTFKVTVRNFFGINPGDLKWCPSRFIAANESCKTKVPFKDTEKVFSVKIRNNTLARGFVQKVIAPDNTATVEPAYYQRSADTVYFLKPTIPIGQVKR
jgi:prepilin-type N-terminal cleavage/methylation domain-containing protein